MKKLLPSLLLVGVLTSTMQAATAAVFLNIPGVPGEATEEAHPQWINLFSMQVGVANKACNGVTVLKGIDTSSPVLSAAALTGGIYSSMRVEVTTADENRSVFLIYAMTNVIVTSVNATTVNATVTETLTLMPATLTITYNPQGSGGPGGSPISYTLTCKK
jgi:type VI protein secretion system component Hcp